MYYVITALVISMVVAIWLGTGGLVVVLRRLPVNSQLVRPGLHGLP